MSHVVETCWACGGAGRHLASVRPFKFKPCWMCYGHRGRTERINMSRETIVKVEVTDRNAIYVNDCRITDRSTKWGVHSTVDAFYCELKQVVATLRERGHTSAIRRIDDPAYPVAA